MKRLSGKFVIRMPVDMHGRLKDEALRKGISLNRLCVEKLWANAQTFGLEEVRESFFPAAFIDRIITQWHKNLVGLVLFGSAARGDATENSDIDLLLVLKPEAKITRDLYRDWDESYREFGGFQGLDRISPHFVSLPGSIQEAGGLWYETAIEGLVLWERGRQVSRFLRCAREAMGRGEIRRRLLHGSPYWIKEAKENNA